MQKIQHYVLFPNHDNGMRLYGILKEAGIKTTIAPTPRVASKCCGISLLVREEDLDTIQPDGAARKPARRSRIVYWKTV